jgi:hypothetical protein
MKMPTSNLGADTLAVFRRVAEIADQSTPPQTAINVLQAWRNALDFNVANNAELLRSISVVVIRLERMREQIKDSKTMEDDQKRIAYEIIEGLLSCTNPKMLHRPITEFSGHFGRDKRAVLNMFSISFEIRKL